MYKIIFSILLISLINIKSYGALEHHVDFVEPEVLTYKVFCLHGEIAIISQALVDKSIALRIAIVDGDCIKFGKIEAKSFKFLDRVVNNKITSEDIDFVKHYPGVILEYSYYLDIDLALFINIYTEVFRCLTYEEQVSYLDRMPMDLKNPVIRKYLLENQLRFLLKHNFVDYILYKNLDVGCVQSIVMSLDEKYLLSGSIDQNIRIWDMKSGELIREILKHDITSIAFSLDNKSIISGDLYGRIRVWNMHSGELINQFRGHHVLRVTSIAISSDGWYVVSGSNDKTIILWHMQSGEKIKVFEDDTEINSVSISLDRRFIFSKSCNYFKKWCISSKNLVEKRWKNFNTALLPNGEYVHLQYYEWLESYDSDGIHYTGYSTLDDKEKFISISAYGKLKVSGSNNGKIRIWCDQDIGSVKSFQAHSGNVELILESINGEYIVSGSSSDKEVKIWKLVESVLLKENPLEILKRLHRSERSWASVFKFW